MSVEMDAYTEIQLSLYDFESRYGIYPNRIILGSNLVDKLINQLYYQRVSEMKLIEVKRADFPFEYGGIPAKIDYNNPDRLEVGYMVEWLKNK